MSTLVTKPVMLDETGVRIAEALEGMAMNDHFPATGRFSSSQSATASADYASAEGNGTRASAVGAHAEGGGTTASGQYAHAEGGGARASGSQAHAEGSGTTASGSQAHAEGGGTTASGSQAHAEGSSTNAGGQYAHAEGAGTEASGKSAHADGLSTVASGVASHAEGLGTVAKNCAQTVAGMHNVPDPGSGDGSLRGTYIEIIGNGTATNHPSNARTLDWEGNEALAGGLTLGEGGANETELTPEQLARMTGNRVVSLDTTALKSGAMLVEALGTPVYVGTADLSTYAAYGLTETGWYVFARITAPEGVTVTSNTTVTGAHAILTAWAASVDVAVRFEVAAMAKTVTVNWTSIRSETFVFRAADLAVRNLDYRTTFYVYDLAPFCTWEYALTPDTAFVAGSRYCTESGGEYTEAVEGTDWTAGDAIPAYYKDQYTLTTDETFVDGKSYYILDGGVYTLATVTTGEAVTADTYYEHSYVRATGTFEAGVTYYTLAESVYTPAEVTVGEPIPAYYKHSKLTIEGMARNVTYQLSTPIDCPTEFVLPAIEDDGHGAWFEFRFRHLGSYSSTLLPEDETVKVATEHTQAETAGMNMVDLHYMSIDGIKIWRFMNTHSSIPT